MGNTTDQGAAAARGVGALRGGPVLPRPEIADLPRYLAGRPVLAVPGLTGFKLSSNETPFAPLPEVIEAVASAEAFNRYPDPSALPLREKLAEQLGVPVTHITASTGSLGVLNEVLRVFAGRHADGSADEVVYPWRSFESYPISVGQTGARAVPVPLLPDLTHDLEGMLAAVTERTSVVILCTPNNPTGPALTHTQVRDFLERVPAHVLVVLDEAYHEYVRGEDQLDAIALYREFGNVLVLRTFSKAHGLAGLRVGYCVAHDQVTQYLAASAAPFSVPHVSQMAAVASLTHLPRVLDRVAASVGEREWLRDELLSLGLDIPAAQGNFLWLPLAERSGEFVDLCAENALAMRQFASEGVRVSIGVREAHERLIAVTRDQFLARA